MAVASSSYGGFAVSGAIHGSWPITNKKVQCGVATSSYVVLYAGVQKVHGHLAYLLPELSMQGKAGATVQLAHSTIYDADLSNKSATRGWSAGGYRNAENNVVSAGSGTLTMSKSGRSGSLSAEMVDTTGGIPHSDKVHVTASWHC